MRSRYGWRLTVGFVVAAALLLGAVPVMIASAVSGDDGGSPSTIPAKVPCGALVPGRHGPIRGVPDLTRDPEAPTYVSTATDVPGTSNTSAHCVVEGAVTDGPSGARIGFRLELPVISWQGRYLQYGCGGFCGQVTDPAFPACGVELGGDFAVSSTDSGHVGENVPLPALDARWAATDQRARDAFNFRAPHLVATASTAVIAAYYGERPRHSYFTGCSDGGREALLLAQRYPDEFDGIIAGAPANYWGPLVGEFHTWMARVNTDPAGNPVLTSAKLPALRDAVLRACDALDGLTDGQLDDPRVCRFDPAAIHCPPGTDTPACLTEAQVAATRRIYAGPATDSGVPLYPGGQQYGSEAAWLHWLVPDPKHPGPTVSALFADGYLRHLGFPIGAPNSTVADWRFTLLDFWRLIPEHLAAAAMNPDLSAFRDGGGKLILWHGWADQAVPATGTIDYYQQLSSRMGGIERTREFARLFLVPGMYHCVGGPETGQVDPVPGIVRWVEGGSAPDRMVASQPDGRGGVLGTRPVFAFPDRAGYTGNGSIRDAANFVSAPPLVPPDVRIRWAGDWLHTLPTPS